VTPHRPLPRGAWEQRLALARLLLKAPSVVVRDEATAHLDSAYEKAIQRALATALGGVYAGLYRTQFESQAALRSVLEERPSLESLPECERVAASGS
jgi:ATPase subunit of ABC transporter with duplicated ATPase domains